MGNGTSTEKSEYEITHDELAVTNKDLYNTNTTLIDTNNKLYNKYVELRKNNTDLTKSPDSYDTDSPKVRDIRTKYNLTNSSKSDKHTIYYNGALPTTTRDNIINFTKNARSDCGSFQYAKGDKDKCVQAVDSWATINNYKSNDTYQYTPFMAMVTEPKPQVEQVSGFVGFI